MKELHPLLKRQIKKAKIPLTDFTTDTPLQTLLTHVSNAYQENDEDRYITTRSFEIASDEMRALREKLQKEKDIIQAVMSEGLCVIDHSWKIAHLNIVGSQLVCASAISVYGKPFYDIFSLYNGEGVNKELVDMISLTALLKEGKIYACDRGILRSCHGVETLVSFSLNPLPLNDNKFDGVVLILKDITKQVEHEQALKNSLYAAEQSNIAKTQFLANMSHEIRTPMNGILGMLQLLKYTTLDETQTNYADKCLESANSLLKILGDILDFAKIESGNTILEKIPFSITEEIDTLLMSYGAQCKPKKIQIRLDFDEQIPTNVCGDLMKIKQVLNNIVNNAIKFTPKEGKIVIDVKLREIQGEDLILAFTVTDTGIGIPESSLEKIFSAFSQADESTTRKFGGTGLGLAISKQLIEQMGGSISVSSQEGSGSAFHFTLPLSLAEQTQQQQRSLQNPVQPLQRFQANILVIEDNIVNQQVAKDVLHCLGCHVDIVDSGIEALKAVSDKRYDLIFMDCQMPEMDGFKTTEKIRQMELQKKIKEGNIIIALTANTIKGTKERCLDSGMNDYLSKPINLQKLSAVLSQYLSENHSDN